MAMENILRERETPVHGVAAGDFRSSDQYFLAFFGRPGFEDTWGWRFLGHHLSLSYTIIGQRWLTVTPCNFGAQPARAGVLAPLVLEEDQGFGLLRSLHPEQRDAAVIHTVAPADYATRQVPFIGKAEYPDAIDLGIPWYRIDNGNHIHSVWRDYRNDLGHDLLAEHYAREQRTGHHLSTRLQSTIADE